MNVSTRLKRSLQNAAFMPFRERWLNQRVLMGLADANAAAEKGHGGEIRLVIERAMPPVLAWKQRVRERAEDLFAHLRVWDTELRSGVLIYLNLAEKRLEIVADRGIDAVVEQNTWQRLCDKAISDIRAGQQQVALETLLANVGDLLREHFGMPDDPYGDELPNRIVLL